MNALTASLIVVVIGAAAFIVAASITARSRIGVLPAEPVQVPSGSSHLWPGLPEAAKQCRVFGWVLVVLLYLLAVFCLLQGLNALRIVHHWQEWQASFGSILTGASGNRALFPVLDRDGDRALSYRHIGRSGG